MALPSPAFALRIRDRSEDLSSIGIHSIYLPGSKEMQNGDCMPARIALENVGRASPGRRDASVFARPSPQPAIYWRKWLKRLFLSIFRQTVTGGALFRGGC
jgi:hypothetical protein